MNDEETLFETWDESLTRVIDHQRWLWTRAQGDDLTKWQEQELAELKQLMLPRKSLLAGRTLFLGGTELVKRREASMFNCAFLETRTVHDMVDAFWLLLQGCGVGFKPASGVLSGFVRKMEHESVFSTKKIGDPKGRENNLESFDPKTGVWTIDIGDSAEAWAKALGKLIAGKYPAKKIKIVTSEVRAAGVRLKGYGWICSGDAMLQQALKAVCGIMNNYAGKILPKTAIWDIINWLGTVLSSRRSAQIGIIDFGDPEWETIATRKPKGFDSGPDWFRSQSNNTIAFYEKPSKKDLKKLFQLMVDMGGSEPGILNMKAARSRAPWAVGLNPCLTGDTPVYTADGRRGVTIKQLADEGKDVPVFCVDRNNQITIRTMRNPRVTGVSQKIYKVSLDNGHSVRVTGNHKFRLRDGTYCKAADLAPGASIAILTRYTPEACSGESYADRYVTMSYQDDQYEAEHRKIAEFHSGTDLLPGDHVHHVNEDVFDNRPGNLDVVPATEHLSGHSSGEANPRFCGVANNKLIGHGRLLSRQLGRRFSSAEWQDYARDNKLPTSFSEWREKSLGTITAFAKRCAVLEGLEQFRDVDPRLARTYNRMLEAGLDAEIVGKKVMIRKSCEVCDDPFTVDHARREQGYCSTSCGNRGRKMNKEEWKDKLTAAHANRKKVRREKQLEVFLATKSALGRDPKKDEWFTVCRAAGLSPEIGRPSSPFTSWVALVEAATVYNHKVVSVTEDGVEDVYNGTVDDFHNFFVGGFDEGLTDYGRRKTVWVNNLQCGEILLPNTGFCNLCEIDLVKFKNDQIDLHRAAYLIGRANYRQTCVNLRDGILQDAWHQTNEYLRLCGVGITGITQRPDITPWEYRQLKYAAVAACYGMADELGLERPKNVTTIKPSGTLSKCMDTTEGAHKPKGRHIINNINFSIHDPLVEKLRKANYRISPHPKDPTCVLAAMPVSYPDVPLDKVGEHEIDNESAVSQMERYKMLMENFVDQNCSITVSYEPPEVPAMVDWYLKNWDTNDLVAMSFLFRANPLSTAADLGYAYLPQEVITKVQFDAYTSKLLPVDIESLGSMSTQDIEEADCPGGVCPTR
jgi:hypothetical protein